MFRIEIEDLKGFRNAIEALKNLIDEGKFTINEEGLKLHALDPSQIAMVIFKMPYSAFSSFSVDGTQSVGLNLENFSKILARGKGNKLVLYDDANKLVVEFIGNKSKKSFKLPMIDVGPGIEREPSVEHDAEVVMKAGLLKDAVKDISLVGSHITFEVRGDSLKVMASGDNAEAELEFEPGEDEGVHSINATSTARATFPVSYLEDIVKGAEDASELKIYLKTNAPIKVVYDVSDANFVYYLAPRIDLD